MNTNTLYDHIEQRYVQVKDITPIKKEPAEEYLPVRTRVEFDRLMREKTGETNGNDG